MGKKTRKIGKNQQNLNGVQIGFLVQMGGENERQRGL